MNKTFELKITAVSTKNNALKYKLIDKLHQLNVHSFVEDLVENLEKETDKDCLQVFSNMEKDQGSFSSILVHSYDEDYLKQIENQLTTTFHSEEIATTRSWMHTHSWKNTWKQNFKPLSIGAFLICPPWDIKQKETHQTIVIEPAMAFGTGQHETTHLCLEQLTDYCNNITQLHKKSMLDVGTGSGILAIAAKKKGFKTVCALDIDQDAILATKSNCKENNCTIHTHQHTLSSKFSKSNSAKFDLIITNILYSTIVDLMPNLAQLMTAQGQLVLSGILSTQQEDLINISATFGLKLKTYKHMNDWCCLCMTFN